MRPNTFFQAGVNLSNPRNKIHDSELYSKWNSEDRDQLKKIILLFGYGRYKKIITYAKNSLPHSKLADKTRLELRVF